MSDALFLGGGCREPCQAGHPMSWDLWISQLPMRFLAFTMENGAALETSYHPLALQLERSWQG